MFTVDGATGAKTGTLPVSWNTYLAMDDGTTLTSYSRFAKEGNVYAFSDPAFVSSAGSLGQVKVLSGD